MLGMLDIQLDDSCLCNPPRHRQPSFGCCVRSNNHARCVVAALDQHRTAGYPHNDILVELMHQHHCRMLGMPEDVARMSRRVYHLPLLNIFILFNFGLSIRRIGYQPILCFELGQLWTSDAPNRFSTDIVFRVGSTLDSRYTGSVTN